MQGTSCSSNAFSPGLLQFSEDFLASRPTHRVALFDQPGADVRPRVRCIVSQMDAVRTVYTHADKLGEFGHTPVLHLLPDPQQPFTVLASTPAIDVLAHMHEEGHMCAAVVSDFESHRLVANVSVSDLRGIPGPEQVSTG